MMGRYFKNNKAFGVVGTIEQQFSFAQIVKSMLTEIFGKEVSSLAISEQPFFVYDKTGASVELELNGESVTLTPEQQGVIAVLRYAAARNLTKISEPLTDKSKQLFPGVFFNQFFIKTDWAWDDIYSLLKEAQARASG